MKIEQREIEVTIPIMIRATVKVTFDKITTENDEKFFSNVSVISISAVVNEDQFPSMSPELKDWIFDRIDCYEMDKIKTKINEYLC
jgi:hypothetical protein